MPTTSTNNFEHISLTAVLTSITNNIGTIKDNMAVIRSDIRVLKTRGDTENLGICTNEVLNEDALQRAVTMIGVKGNNAIADVSSEMKNPTPLP